jgi:hypothetical protein
MKKDWRELISQPKYGITTEKDVFVPARGERLMTIPQNKLTA